MLRQTHSIESKKKIVKVKLDGEGKE
jgi:hypothetical protein